MAEAVPRHTRGQATGAAAQGSPSGAPSIVGLDRVVALCDDILPLVTDYCGCLSVKRGVEHRLAFRARRGFRYDTLVQVEVFKHVLDQFEQQCAAPSRS